MIFVPIDETETLDSNLDFRINNTCNNYIIKEHLHHQSLLCF
jgi:hypothetical protein